MYLGISKVFFFADIYDPCIIMHLHLLHITKAADIVGLKQLALDVRTQAPPSKKKLHRNRNDSFINF